VSLIRNWQISYLLKRNKEIPVLPINSIKISYAVDKKICKVSKQLFCSCQIGDKQIHINFKQVESLNEQTIGSAKPIRRTH